MQVPFIIYADFESLNILLAGCTNNPEQSIDRQIAVQRPCGYYCIVVCCNGHVKTGHLYWRENATQHFLWHTMAVSNGWWWYGNGTICGSTLDTDCTIAISPQSTAGQPTMHATSSCSFTQEALVLLVFYNLRGYDSHLLMQVLGGINWGNRTVRHRTKKGKWLEKEVENGAIHYILNNMEEYMLFCIGQLQLIDSLQFMPSFLKKLAANLQTEDLKITGCGGEGVTSADLELFQHKGIYPYEHVDSFERFNKSQLPPKEAFYSHISREHISKEGYEHAQRIWKVFS